MNAIRLLLRQHREVESLFAAYGRADDDASKQAAYDALADTLAAHFTIEEALLYPAASVGPLASKLQEAVEEHLAAKRLLTDLLAMNPMESNFDAKVTVLREQISHHVAEEEDVVFPAMRELMPARELDTLGEAMQRLFDTLLRGAPRQALPRESQSAAPLD